MRLITKDEASHEINRQLISSDNCDRVARDAALIRSCTWALTRGERPIFTLKLLNLAIELSPDRILDGEVETETVRERLRGSLEELAEAGDLVSLAKGRWLPAPTRQVVLRTADDARLMVGGLPTSVLPRELAKEIRHHGAFRRFTGNRLENELSLPFESFESWVGMPPRDLKAWTRSVLGGTYEAFSEPDDANQFTIYAPQAARQGAIQVRRWFERGEKLSGRFLARRDLPFGMRQYRCVELIDGHLVRVCLPQFGTGDLRRLMYGLDALAGNPVGVETHKTRDQYVVVLANEVPRPERRLFAALGGLTVPPDKYYPRTWTFPVKYADEISSRLEALCVCLNSRPSSKV